MNKSKPEVDKLIHYVSENESRFEKAMTHVQYDEAGMWFSELITFCAIVEYIGCDKIIESGRSRGVSTQFLAEYFSNEDLEIVSVDNRPNSRDAKIAEEKLKDYGSLDLRYGDARKIVPQLTTSDTAVLIDGPKGDLALQMGIELFEEDSCPVVGIHDLHKGYFRRDISEMVFCNKLYTDNSDIVSELKQYDDNISQSPYSSSWKGSYSPTLGVFFRDEKPVNERIKDNYLEYINRDIDEALADLIKTGQTSDNQIIKQISTGLFKIGRFKLKVQGRI